MKVNYCLDRKDVFALQIYGLLHNRILHVVLVGSVLLQFYNSFAGPVRWVVQGNALQDAESSIVLRAFTVAATQFAFGLLVTGAAVIFVNILLIIFLALKFKNGDGLIGEHQIVLNETSLIEITDVNETSHGWKSVQKIVDWTSYVLIYVSPTNAHIIPKRSFANERDAAIFIDEAKRLRENAQTTFSPSYLAANS